jgi:predicted NAD-dependent protein-ADP-ribosyltransferase YbiA (DUF1768 family)
MKVLLKHHLIIFTAESEEERSALAAWANIRDAHVFALTHQDEQTCLLKGLGPRAIACREPINVTSRAPDPQLRLISNLAHTPFHLDGQEYASVEAFWQGLKFPDAERRQEIAHLHGHEARHAGFAAQASETLEYRGQVVRVGTADHWQLMSRACWAKFNQHTEARHALLSTGDRPLTHRVRRDSRNVPGVIMAQIWMNVRRGLRKIPAHSGDGQEEVSGP